MLYVDSGSLRLWPQSPMHQIHNNKVTFNPLGNDDESLFIEEKPTTTHICPSPCSAPSYSMSHLMLCIWTLLHQTTTDPFRHQGISGLFSTQQICCLDSFPEYFGIHPFLVCSLVWHRSRGQRGGDEGGTRIVSMLSFCGKQPKIEKWRREGERVIYSALFCVSHNIWTWIILCRTAPKIEPLPKNIQSWTWMETVTLPNECCKVMNKWWEAGRGRDDRKMGKGRERNGMNGTRVRKGWEADGWGR